LRINLFTLARLIVASMLRLFDLDAVHFRVEVEIAINFSNKNINVATACSVIDRESSIDYVKISGWSKP